ncbi:hypothetical protein CYY_009553 [Polysphondylium violaceum]|uniref:FNIP repeat-containing protein n=1 Tax=Polysphondylium violaceum TaxID=133409 RepID=A0A8J4PLE3_9MYCE|nr:hypothetical protein CYY_009553 [Polysphondylium violaceum]
MFFKKHNNILFFSIWRDKYIRRTISNNRLKNKVIPLGVGYLERNHEYFELLDRSSFNILLEIVLDNIELQSLIKSEYSSLIDSLNIDLCKAEHVKMWDQTVIFKLPFYLKRITLTTSLETRFDLKCLPNTLEYLSIALRKINVVGDLAPGTALKTLILHDCPANYLARLLMPTLEHLVLDSFQGELVLDTLPSNLKTLAVNHGRAPIGTPPDSLTDLRMNERPIEALVNITAPNKIYPNVVAKVDTPASFELVSQLKWLTHIIISNATVVGTNRIPSHIRKLVFNQYNLPLPLNLLPRGLVSLEMGMFNQTLVKKAFPAHLKTLILPHFNTPVEKGVFPVALESLSVAACLYPLDLPPQLKEITLTHLCVLPPNPPRTLKTLIVKGGRGGEIDIPKNSIPPFISTLILQGEIKVDSFHLPLPTIRAIHFQRTTSIRLSLPTELIPPSVTDLSIDNHICISPMIPNSVEKLLITEFSNRCNLPASLKRLDITASDFVYEPYVGHYIPINLTQVKENLRSSIKNPSCTIKINGIFYQ